MKSPPGAPEIAVTPLSPAGTVVWPNGLSPHATTVPGSIAFSNDGKRVAYVVEIAREGRLGRHVVVDDRVEPEFARVRGTPRLIRTTNT